MLGSPAVYSPQFHSFLCPTTSVLKADLFVFLAGERLLGEKVWTPAGWSLENKHGDLPGHSRLPTLLTAAFWKPNDIDTACPVQSRRV